MEDTTQPVNSQPEPEAAGPESAEKLTQLEAQCQEYLAGWKRTQADFINYKKDESRRLTEAAAFSNKELIADILPVLDSFDLALSTIDKESPAYKGAVLIRSQLMDVLKRQGVERIRVSRGDELDANLHEALVAVELNQEDEKEKELSSKVLEELSAGYMLNGRVIRPAKVKIGK